MMRCVVSVIFALIVFMPVSASAQCAALPTGASAALQVGGTAGTGGVYGTNSAGPFPVGSISYDSSQTSVVQCKGTTWQALGGGGSLGVYDANGTLLGPFLGFGINTSNINYASGSTPYTASSVRLVTNDSSSIFVDRVFFSGANCTGTIYMSDSQTRGYGCTGSATCTSNLVAPVGQGSQNLINTASSRNAGGICSNGLLSYTGLSLTTVYIPPACCAVVSNTYRCDLCTIQ